ncbi:MAG: glycosyltransferase family 2 protein [Bacteroidaceae bacterium]|nr:glycosyltransferase family 2 protein [Bacteroidaceae bacterium]
MKITVVIPVYNTADTLGRCIDSIISQTHADWEAIVVDDGSTDDSPRLCDDYARNDPRIRVIHKANGGLSDARNAALDVAGGEWVTFIDSDDFVAPDTLEAIAKAATDEPEAELIEYPATLKWGDPMRQQELMLTPATHPDAATYWLETKAYTHTYACNKAFRNHLLKHVRFPKGKKFEDAWTLPQVLAAEPCIVTIEHGHYYYTWNPRGITATATGKDMHSLLKAQLEASRLLNIDLQSTEAAPWYMALLNLQIDSNRKLNMPPELPARRLPLSAAQTMAERIKIIILNTCGLNALCKIMRVIK